MKKRSLLITLLSLILTFSVSIGLTTTKAYAEEAPVEYSMGDANLDGNVNTRDVVLIKQSIVGLTELTDKQKVFADVYADGQINTRDVVLIQQSIVGMDVDLGTHEHEYENGVCICGHEKEGFRVVWENYDGTVLKTLELENIESIPSYDGEMPTREKDAQYTYAFSGWREKTTTNRVVYTAQYSTTINKYTVTWKNHDGTVLETDTEVTYGTIPTYNGNTPVKEKDAQYTYSFNSWDKTISAVVGHITYTAKFSNTVNKYTITWKNYDGSILKTDSVAYGSKPSYMGTTPTKQGDEQYGYLFEGWSPIVVNVVGDAVYTAQFTSSLNKYTVTWKNYDGTVLETDTEVSYGETPIYNGSIPTKEKDAQYTYTFSGWSPVVSKITDDVIYTAQYSTTINKCTVVWKNYDGTILETDTEVLYGTMPVYNGSTPTREKDAQYTYTFNGWATNVSNVTGDIVYIAQFKTSVNAYTVVWKNYDGTVLETDSEVPYGTMPTYNGNIPAKQGDEQYGYAFNGWSPAVSNVTGDMIYIATFVELINTYTVTWLNADGTILEQDNYVLYGTMPIYDGETPTRERDSQYEYIFERWNTSITLITQDVIYVAQYSIEESVSFIIKYDANGGTGAPSSQTKNKGQSITLSSTIPTNGEYVFMGWFCAYDGKTYDKRSSFCVDANITLCAIWGHGCVNCEAKGVVTVIKDCEKCENGKYSSFEWKECAICTGKGYTQPTCSSCRGDGYVEKYCRNCGGSGQVPHYSGDLMISCGQCGGSGRIDEYCSNCGGSGNMRNPCSTCLGAGGAYKDVVYTCKDCTNGNKYISTTCSICLGDKFIRNENGASNLILMDNGTNLYKETIVVGNYYKLQVPAKDGYTFIGWFDDNGKQYTDRYGVSLNVWDEENNKTLYAQWIEDYSITYILNGGDATNLTNYNIETSEFALNIPTREGYTFIGWTGANGDVPELNVSIKFGTVGDLEFVANWSINQYTITLVFNNGNDNDEIEFDYQEEIVIDNPIWNRKSFVGWYEDEDLTINHSYTIMPNKNYTLYAKWETYNIDISYNEAKTAISINDEINAELFDATAIDTDETVLDVKVEIISGQLQVGETITVRLTVSGLYNVRKVQTITDVRVYGTPTLTCDTKKGYINMSDKLVGNLFSAIGADTFGNATDIVVTAKEGEYKAGDIVTIVVTAIDVAGNETAIEIPNVKVYGTPIINRDATIVDMRVSEIVSNEKFVVCATDSFGVSLTVATEIVEGEFAEGNIITVRSSATDSKGNVGYVDYDIKVYGLPTISNAANKNFKVEDEITLDSLGIVAKDSFGNELENVTLTLQNGKQEAGAVLTYIVVAIDHLGNENSLVIDNVRIFGAPEIKYKKELMNVNQDGLDVNTLQVSAKDSFGSDLIVHIELKSGIVVGGETVVYTFTTTDLLGNIAVMDTLPIKVYDVNDIVINFNKYASDLIKLSSCGEEFFATAIDSFGESITLQVVAVDGELTAGAIESIKLVAIDGAGNVKESEIIENIKVYGLPTITYKYDGDYIDVSDNPYALFDVKDSFDEELSFDVEIIDGEKEIGKKITYKVIAEDIAGNRVEEIYTLRVIVNGKVTVSFDVNGGDSLDNDLVLIAHNESFELEIPTRTGYKFIGWSFEGVFYTDKNGNSIKAFDESFNIATLTANWSKIYAITYELSGGSTTNVTEYTIESETIVLSNPTKDHYDFVEWQLDGKKITEIESGSIGDKTIVAVWTPTDYSIDYELNGCVNNDANVDKYTIESETIVLSNPTKEHYDFVEWQLDGKKVTEIASGSYGNKRLVAIWMPTVYTITYELNGGNAVNETTYTIESETIVLSNPTKDHYDFVEWQLDGKKVTEIASGSYGDKTIVAVWTPNVYTITYQLNGGDATNVGTYTIESGSIILTNPTKTGYKFLGWSGTDIDGMSTNVVIPSGSTGNREYTAKWEAITYTITYELDGRSTTNVTEYTIESETIVLSNPTKDHYDFVEWQLDGKKVTEIASGSYGDKTIVAVWTPTVYSITYELDGGSTINEATYTIESEDIILNNPTKTGYTFLGWSGTEIDGMSTNVVIPSGSTGNREYTANWEIITYTITYELDGGTTTNNTEYTIESESIILSNPTKEHYDFVEWQLNGERVTEIAKGGYGDKTLVAVWTPTVYTITYELNGGENHPDNIIVNAYTVESFTIIPKAPTKISYEFIGWYTESAYINEIEKIKNGSWGDITLYAKWQSIFIYADGAITGLTEYGQTLEEIVVLSMIDGIEINAIGANAFDSNETMCNITIPNTITTIGAYAFKKCNQLQNIYYEGGVDEWCSITGLSTLMSHDANLYINGKIIKGELIIPDNVTSITSYAFYNRTDLTSIIVGENVESIGYYSFYDCESLTSVTLGKSIKTIDSKAFGYGPEGIFKSVTKVNYRGALEQWCVIRGLVSLMSIGPDLFFNDVLVQGILRIPDSVTEISNYAFYNVSITKVVFGTNILTIGAYAFYRCDKLTKIEFNNKVETINGYAFCNCDALIGIDIPDSVKSIGYSAFSNCNSLAEVHIGSGVTMLNSETFSGCDKLIQIIIPTAVTKMGSGVFRACYNVKIYSEFTSKPSGWDSYWAGSGVSTNNIYWYSENQPTTSGNYWHYDENGNIVVW